MVVQRELLASSPVVDGGATSRAAVVRLIAAFVMVHAVLSLIDLRDHVHWPLGDVVGPYADWATAWRDHGVLWGVSTDWVYPAGAPLVMSLALGPTHCGLAWLALVTVLDGAALVALAGKQASLGWWRLAFTACRGRAHRRGRAAPRTLRRTACGHEARDRSGAADRCDVDQSLAGGANRVALRGGATASAGRARSRVTCATIVAVALIAGADADGSLFGFLGQQTTQALQVKVPVSWPWLLLATQGEARVFYDTSLLTVEVAGPGAVEAAALMTPLLLVVLILIFGGSFFAIRRGAVAATDVLPYDGLASTVALIAVDKVGSPQYVTWLVAPIVLGLLIHGRRFSVPAIGTLAIAALTQVVYPWFYESLVRAEPWMVAAIGLRDLLEVLLLGWSVARIVSVIGLRRPARLMQSEPHADEPVTVPVSTFVATPQERERSVEPSR